MALLQASTCRACRHPQCKAVPGGDLCAFCEDHTLCPVSKGVQVPPQPLPPHKPAVVAPPIGEPATTEATTADAKECEPRRTKKVRRCACGCGEALDLLTKWDYKRGHKMAMRAREAVAEDPKPTPRRKMAHTTIGGVTPTLRTVDQTKWFETYSRVAGIYDSLIAEVEAAPMPHCGELEFANNRLLKNARAALEHRARGSKVYRLRFSVHPSNPNVLGVLKEARA